MDHTHPEWPRDNRIRADEAGENRIVEPGSIIVQSGLDVKLLAGELVSGHPSAIYRAWPQTPPKGMCCAASV